MLHAVMQYGAAPQCADGGCAGQLCHSSHQSLVMDAETNALI